MHSNLHRIQMTLSFRVDSHVRARHFHTRLQYIRRGCIFAIFRIANGTDSRERMFTAIYCYLHKISMSRTLGCRGDVLRQRMQYSHLPHRTTLTQRFFHFTSRLLPKHKKIAYSLECDGAEFFWSLECGVWLVMG